MKLIIHRGTHQIGGCATELRTGTTRILIDLGSPLPGQESIVPTDTLDLSGVTRPGVPCDGIFFTHTHGDHIGELDRVLPSVPLWLGKTAREVSISLCRRLESCSAANHASMRNALERARTFSPGVPITVGDIRLTPLLVDHSAFDAYMFLIEAEGLRILHTGDFRSHGPRGKALLPVLRRYIGKVDWLICEGTTLSRKPQSILTEAQLGQKVHSIMKKHRHIFALCASTNIDRIATIYHSRPLRRPALCDDYQKELLETVQHRAGGKSRFYCFDRLISYSPENRKLLRWMEEQGFLMFIRANPWFRDLMEPYRNDCVVLFSMWDGYLHGPCKNDRLAEFLDGFPVIHLHTSGHAGPETLREVCRTVSPHRGLIPIHGEVPEAFRTLLPETRIVCLEDGQVLNL